MPRPPKATPYDDKINVWPQRSRNDPNRRSESRSADASNTLHAPSPQRSQPTPAPGYPARSHSSIPPSDPAATFGWDVSPPATTHRDRYHQASGHAQVNTVLPGNTNFQASSSSSYYAPPNMQQPNPTQTSPPASFSRSGAETPMRYHWVMQFVDPLNSYPTRHATCHTGRFQVPVIGCPCGMQIQILYLPAFTLEPNCLNRQNILPLWNFRGIGNSGNVWIEGPNFQQSQCLSEQQCPQCGTCLRVLLQPVAPQPTTADNSVGNLGYQ